MKEGYRKTVTSVDHEFEIINDLVNSIPSSAIANSSFSNIRTGLSLMNLKG